MIEFEPKDPSDLVDYRINWTGVSPIGSGDTIASIESITITPVTVPPLEEVEDQRAFTDITTTYWLRGGLAGEKYTVAVKVITAAGRDFERSATLKVKEL